MKQKILLCYSDNNLITLESKAMDEQDWKSTAKNILKSELARKGVDYETLSVKLKDLGIEESYNSINTKINRGAFTFQFFLQCMKALGIDSVRLG